MEDPLVSINIPSYNSEKMIPFCLEGVKKQKYSNIEILVIDSYSTDRTREIAKNCGAKIILCQGKLLESRILGVKESKGEYILFLDTDMILKEDTVDRVVKLAQEQNLDMVVLEEKPYFLNNKKGVISRLHSAWLQFLNAHFNDFNAFHPLTGGIFLPRFFKKEILEKPFRIIPKELIPEVIHYDHHIIYFEAYKISQRVGGLRDAVYAIEPDFRKLWKTRFRYGASVREVKKSPYWKLFLEKSADRFLFGRPLWLCFQAILFILISKAIQKVGYYFGRVS